MRSVLSIGAVNVFLGDARVGTLARDENGLACPETDDLLAVAQEFGLPKARARDIASSIHDACHDLLARNGLAG